MNYQTCRYATRNYYGMQGLLDILLVEPFVA